MEPYKLSGRAFFGVAVDLSYGSLLLCAVILFTVIGFEGNFLNIGFLAMYIFVAGLTLFLFIHMFKGLKTKFLEIDDAGVRYYEGQRLKWDFLWTQIESIYTSAFGGKYPRAGLGLKAGGKRYDINNRDDLGPKEELVKAFRILAKESLKRNISMNDNCGWAGDIIPAWIRQQQMVPNTGMEGRWLSAQDPHDPVKKMSIFFMGPIIAIGLIFILLAGSVHEELSYWGYMFTIVGLIFIPILGLLYGTTMNKLWFNNEKISLKFPFNRLVTVRWSEVRKLGVNPETGYFAIWLYNGKSWLSFFPEDVCDAVRIRFALKAPGRVEMM